MRSFATRFAVFCFCAGFVFPALAAPRDVMFRSVDFDNNIVELHNFGASSEDLSGWRFCTHDDNEILRYSAATGLNGVTLAAGTSLFVHFDNDAPALPDRVDISTLGGAFALPLDRGPYGLGIYFPPVNFGNGNTMADYVQWSNGGANDPTADERADEAVAGGLWSDTASWASTAGDSSRILLNQGAEMGVFHSAADYTEQQDGAPAPASSKLTLLVTAIALALSTAWFVRRRVI